MEEFENGAVTPEPETETEPAPQNNKTKKIILFSVIGVVAALCVAYLALCYMGNTKEIDTQYEVNGINITGMDRKEAEAAILKQFENEYSDSAYEIKIEDLSFKVPVFDYLALDPSEGINAALSYDGGPWIGRGMRYLKSRVSGVDTVQFKAVPELSDRDGVYKEAEAIAKTVFQEPVESSWKEDNGNISITLGEAGKSVDAKTIGDEITAGIEKGDYSGNVSSSFELTEPKELDLKEIVKAVHVDPVSATYGLNNGELEVSESKNGKEITEEDLQKALKEAKPGTTILVPETVLNPDLTSEKLQNMLLADKISGYIVIDGGSWTQINNQSLACEAINGKILMPGDVFSFNELVGDTTPDKGYVEDYAYENNKLVKQYGGGICRVASTLYAAVLYTNLEIVERHNHSSPVHYLPLGMDATVSYPEPDLMFRNNRDYPIRIFMYLGDGYVHAEIYGTYIEGEPYVDVELNYQTSMLVDTYRNYYTSEGGELLSSEFMHTSSYRDLIPDPTPTPSPTPKPSVTPAPTAAPEPTSEPTPEPTVPSEPIAPEQSEEQTSDQQESGQSDTVTPPEESATEQGEPEMPPDATPPEEIPQE